MLVEHTTVRLMPSTRALIRAAGRFTAAAALALAGCQSSSEEARSADTSATSEQALVAALPAPALVKDMLTGTAAQGISADNFIQLSTNRTIFTTYLPQYGKEPWVTDGTAAGTSLLADIWPGGAPTTSGQGNSGFLNFAGSSAAPIILNGKLLFVAQDGAHGYEPWVTDGTPENTKMLKDIFPGATGSTQSATTNWFVGATLFPDGNRVLFLANDGVHGAELWVTDGTPDGTKLVKDATPGPGSSTGSATNNWITVFAAYGDQLVFGLNDGTNGIEPWITNGTESGTKMLANLREGAKSSNPGSFKLVNDRLYFTATDLLVEDQASTTKLFELAVTDGTPDGTRYLEVNPNGPSQASVTSMVAFKGQVYFTAGVHTVALPACGLPPCNAAPTDVELWKTNGTQAGTVRVKDINTATDGSSAPSGLRVVGNYLVFLATNGTSGNELWSTDGIDPDPAPAPDTHTVMLYDVTSPNAGSALTTLANSKVLGDKLYFIGKDPVAGGSEWWVTDGTVGGTKLFFDISAGNTDSGITNVNQLGDVVYFTANTDQGTTLKDGLEWWRLDGSATGTTMLPQIAAGTAGSGVANVNLVGSTIFFTAKDAGPAPLYGTELWKLDASGLARLSDINTAGDTSFAGFAVVGNRLFFNADASSTNREPFVATSSGVQFIGDLNTTTSSSASTFTVVNGNLMLLANDGTGVEWFFQPGFTGTPTKLDLFPQINSSFPIGTAPTALNPTTAWFTALGSKLFFAASVGVGNELYVTDGTEAGTVLAADINTTSGTADSKPSEMVTMGDTLYFAASDGTTTGKHGNEIWRLDVTPGSPTGYTAAYVKDINNATSDSLNSNGVYTAVVGVEDQALYFKAAREAQNFELWKSYGIDAELANGQEINPGTTGSAGAANPFAMTGLGDQVFFFATDGSGATAHGTEPWISGSDGSSLLKDIAVGPVGSTSESSLVRPVATQEFVYFVASDIVTDANSALVSGTYGPELWKTDGTPAGTVLVKDIRTGMIPSQAGPLVPAGSNIASLTVRGNDVFFVATDDTNGAELWITDGTTEGTRLVKDIFPGVGSSNPAELTEVYGRIFFAATGTTGGRELWVTDGTADGTVMVKDIAPGEASSSPAQLSRFGNVLLFGASDGLNGRELWQSDGTAAGTVMLGEIWPGSGSSEPGKAVQAGTRAYFLATSPTIGREMFSTSLPATDTVAPAITCPANVELTTETLGAGTAEYGDARGYDDRQGAVTFTYSHASGSTFPIGATEVTVTGKDEAQNSSTCKFTVTRTYHDLVKPEITCPANMAVTSHAFDGIAVSFTVEATDDAGAVTLSYDHAPASTFTTGKTTVNATATDGSGNTKTCSFDVTVTFEDNTKPTVTCPTGPVVETNISESKVAIWDPAIASDDAHGEVTIAYTRPGASGSKETVASGNLFPVGVTQVTASATDETGNEGTCTFEVRVNFIDVADPTITSCPSNVAVDSTLAGGIAVTYPLASATDADSGVDPSITYSKESGSTFPVGETTVLVTATDGANHSAVCSFLVVVTLVDDTPPVVTCPADFGVPTEVREGATVTYAPAVATDNLTASPSIIYDHESGSFLPLGDTIVTATAKDEFDNTGSCSFTVTVNLVDDTLPVVSCPADVTATAHAKAGVEVEYPAATAEDNLTEAPALTYSRASGSLFPVGETVVTASAEDEFENVGTCTFKVTVALVDIGKPTLTCPAAQSVTALEDAATVTWPEAVATDDIDATVAVTYVPANGSSFAIGKTPVTATARDLAGNEATCTFDVDVAEGGCGCQGVDPTSFFALAGVAALLRRRRR